MANRTRGRLFGSKTIPPIEMSGLATGHGQMAIGGGAN